MRKILIIGVLLLAIVASGCIGTPANVSENQGTVDDFIIDYVVNDPLTQANRSSITFVDNEVGMSYRYGEGMYYTYRYNITFQSNDGTPHYVLATIIVADGAPVAVDKSCSIILDGHINMITDKDYRRLPQ